MSLAEHLSRRAAHAHPAPTEAQKRAGNYRKGHVRAHGLDVTIENPRGSFRSGVEKNGKPWRVLMAHHYGYVKRSEGADGDHVDVYIGPHLKSPKIFVVDQRDADSGHFDEHKAFMGFATRQQVERAYRRAFSDGRGHERMGAVTEMTPDEFRAWIEDGDTKKPLHRAAGGRISGFDDGGGVAADDWVSAPADDWVQPASAPVDHGAPSAPATLNQPAPSSQPTSALDAALSPITSYPSVYSGMVHESVDQMGRGLGQIESGSPWEMAKGAGNLGLGAVSYVGSPINAALRTVVGQPVQDVTGIPREYAEFAAGLALPGIGLGKAATAANAAERTAPSIDALYSAAEAAYNSPEVKALKLHPGTMPVFGQDAAAALTREGFDPLLAPKTFGLLEKAATVSEGQNFVTADNIQTLRRMLGKAAASTDPTEKAAAVIAQRRLDDFMSSLPKGAVLSGDADAASATLQQARGNYAAASRAETLQTALEQADRQAARAGVGGNLENATRQRITALLNSPSKIRGFTDAEKDAMEQYVQGNFTRNSLRVATKVLGGDNPLMASIHAGLAWPTHGLSLAAPATGYLLKRFNNSLSAGDLSKIDEMLRTRSPLAQQTKDAVTAWARDGATYSQQPTTQSATRFFASAQLLANSLKNAGVSGDVRQLVGPFQLPGEGNAETDQGNVPRPPAQQKHGGAVAGQKHFASGGAVMSQERKAAHDLVHYTPRAKDRNERCEKCTHFIDRKSGGQACQIVKSPIARSGWCQLFEAQRSGK